MKGEMKKMSYYHIKNIDISKKKNKISADLADSSLYPISYFHVDNLSNKETFEEKYADFIFNVVSGNFHPQRNNVFYRIMMDHWLENYYDDAHDIGSLATYHKYKDVVDGLLTNNESKLVMLPSERELNPERYYVLKPIKLDVDYDGDYYINEKGVIYNYTKEKGLQDCENREISTYGKPYGKPYELDKFIQYNKFLKEKDKELEM